MMRASKYILPTEVQRYFRHLDVLYSNNPRTKILSAVIQNSTYTIDEAISYDNWDGGLTSHSLKLFIPESILYQIGSLDSQTEIANRIRTDFNKASASITSEQLESVYIELLDGQSEKYTRAIKTFDKKSVDLENSQIWKEGYLRVFISHKDKYKCSVSELKDSLEKYGVSCFVAHENIEPLTEWHDEIEKALFTADALLIYLTDDFSESEWTDQEVGVAIGRNIPIIPLKMGRKNPYGLFSKWQALKGSIEDLDKTAAIVFERLVNSIPKSDLVRDGLVEAFATSSCFEDSIFHIRELLPTIKRLTPENIDRIQGAFAENDQLHNCVVVNKDLPALLKRHTREEFVIQGKRISRVAEDNGEAPF